MPFLLAPPTVEPVSLTRFRWTRCVPCNTRCTGRQGRSGRRFHALWGRVFAEMSCGARGCGTRRQRRTGHQPDHLGLDQKEYGIDRLLDELSSELRGGSYRPLPARRVYIPKPGSADHGHCRFPRCVIGCASRAEDRARADL